MKFVTSVIVLVLAINFSYAQDTTVAPTKTCKDFLPEQTCESLLKLLGNLKESASTLQEAVNAAIAQQKTSAKDMLAFIKGFIAERMSCNKVLTDDLCTAIFAVAQKLKLTTQQVKLAIENAVAAGKATAKDIYDQAIKLLTGQISCEKIFGATACNNILAALDKFHEQRALLKEAIMSVALKPFNTAKDMLAAVKQYVISKIVDFKCETVLPADMCTKITAIAQRLKLLPSQVKEAIEMAILNGAMTAKAIQDAVINILTTKINCANILTPTACQNLLNATKKLHEQAQLIREAIMAAALKQITDAKEIYKSVRDALVEKAINFKCTDVLPEQQCTLLTNIAMRFHVRAQTLRRILIEAVINGTSTARQIYQATIGVLIEDAKSLKCEDMIDPDVCKILDAFAANLRLTAQDVTNAVKDAIISGKKTIKDILAYAKNIIVDERSCEDFFSRLWTGRLICKGLQTAAYLKGISFDVVIAKIRELYANGVTRYEDLKARVLDFIKKFAFGDITKRSIEVADQVSTKDELIDMVMQIIGGIMKVTDKVKGNIKAELRKLYDDGKLRITKIRQTIKDLISKYTLLGDEVSSDEQDVINDLKQKIKDLKANAKEQLNALLTKLREAYEKLMKQFPSEVPAQDYLVDIEEFAKQSLDEQINDAIKSLF